MYNHDFSLGQRIYKPKFGLEIARFEYFSCPFRFFLFDPFTLATFCVS